MKSFLAAAGLTLVVAAGLSGCASRPKAPPMTAPEPAPAVAPPSEPAPAPAPPVVGVRPGSQEDLAATAGERVFFALDSHALSAEARATLDAQAVWLARYPDGRIVIAGNADERGTREYNLALGARRASAARAYLVSRGVAASRLSTVSYGKERPIDAGAGEQAWSRNRNAHTMLEETAGRGW